MSRLVHLLRERMRMLRDDAAAVAKVVEEAFRGESELDDDLIDPQLRQVFYDLQDEEILKVRRTEYEKDGRHLRGYFWSVDGKERHMPTPIRRQPDEFEALYESVRDQDWTQRRQA